MGKWSRSYWAAVAVCWLVTYAQYDAWRCIARNWGFPAPISWRGVLGVTVWACVTAGVCRYFSQKFAAPAALAVGAVAGVACAVVVMSPWLMTVDWDPARNKLLGFSVELHVFDAFMAGLAGLIVGAMNRAEG